MLTELNSRVISEKSLEGDFIVVGGGLSGICAAISAARHGARVVLIQDRPMLGGNCSSEMRMGIMGAHGDDNKEAGILEELQLKNFYYNPLMRYTLWDDIFYSTVREEPNITLLLNTSVYDVESKDGEIALVKAWNSNAQTRYAVSGRIFADCSGDSVLRLSGAKFRHGRELPSEFNESYLAHGGDNRTMGNSILMQLRRTDEHHPFIAPKWAYHFTDADFMPPGDTPVPNGAVRVHYRKPYPDNNNFWWVEYGGNLNTIHDANEIQFELKKIAYGVWEYMKNHPDGRAKGYDLDWIGALPGKRESARYMGHHILTQDDVMAGGRFDDVVAYGGWTLDDHHPDAFHAKGSVSVEYGCPSPFGIPFDCLRSENIPNLLFAGRNISCTHMGLSATRVMGTCAILGQAIGTAAALALEMDISIAELRHNHIDKLQATLENDDCMLPYRWREVSALAKSAKLAPEYTVLVNGIDRGYAGEDNGVWVEPGDESVIFTWDSPQVISGARLVFDSAMSFQGKRMLKLEAERNRKAMPEMMAKAFRIDAFADGNWRTVFSDALNILRFRTVSFESVSATKLRLVVEETWGGEKAHIFACDPL